MLKWKLAILPRWCAPTVGVPG